MNKTGIQKIDENFGNNAFNNNGLQIGQQNNFYSLKIMNSLKIKEDLEIKVYKNVINKIEISNLLFGAFLMSLIYLVFVWLFDIKPYSTEFIRTLIFLFLIISGIFIFLSFFSRYFSSMQLTLNEEAVKLKKGEKDIVLKYSEIRSILKMKDLVGYSINIYKIDEINPSISFNTESIHFANAINELIVNHITNEKNKNRQKLLKQ